MKSTAFIRSLAVVLALSLFGTGCGKKEAEETAAAPAAPATEEAAPAEETASTSEESTTDTVVVQAVNVQDTLNASDNALKSKNWEGATDNLLKLQMSGSMKTDAESWQYNRRMTVLQDQLVQAADAGDPKAQAAIERLRKSRRVQ